MDHLADSHRDVVQAERLRGKRLKKLQPSSDKRFGVDPFRVIGVISLKPFFNGLVPRFGSLRFHGATMCSRKHHGVRVRRLSIPFGGINLELKVNVDIL